MMNKTLILLTLLCLIFTSPIDSNAQNPLEQLQVSLESDNLLTASISHSFIDVYTGDTLVNKATIWLVTKGYKIEMPNRSILVIDKESSVWDKRNHQLIISNYFEDDDDFAPSRLIAASQDEYQIMRKGSVYSFIPTNDFAAFKQIEITLDKNGLPLKIVAKDQAENLNITHFMTAKIIPYNHTIFNLETPSDIEIIDLREGNEE